MLSLNYENLNYVMTQILKLSCASFSYENISYVLAFVWYVPILSLKVNKQGKTVSSGNHYRTFPEQSEAQYFYSFQPSYEALYEASQMFCFDYTIV